MATPLLDGVRVLDLAGETAVVAGRILGDLGAEVVRVTPVGGCDLTGDGPGSDPLRAAVWNASKRVVALSSDDEELAGLLAGADIIIDTPRWPGVHHLDSLLAPRAIWVHVTPFGSTGPRAEWIASDLGVMAASGNLYCTGDPDRAPLTCTEQVASAHTGPEAALAALSALAAGVTGEVDVSMQETVLIANMGAVGRFGLEGVRGQRRGANIGRTREIWPCADGWVSFGIRGGKARVGTWATMERLLREDGLDVSALESRDWAAFNHNTAETADLDAIAAVIGTFFDRHTMTDLYELACEHNLTLAPINSPREIAASVQMRAREFLFEDDHVLPLLPRHFALVRDPDHEVDDIEPRAPATTPAETSPWMPRPLRPSTPPERAWTGTTIVEFGSGAAGPIASRFFAEHGATVIRIESRSRPDFLRAYALSPKNPHGLDGAPMFDSLNPGKQSITLNLKHERGRELAIELIKQADAVAENFAPKALPGLGLDYDSLVAHKPDLVMISACLNGQTGPHKDYPGFGGQGAALAGFNYLTGWPDREPVGPYGTITDSLAPRFVAAALAAGLLYRRRTGKGCYLDLSQVEAGAWSLSPWIAAFGATGEIADRTGNRSTRFCPHGIFPVAGKDRWIAIVCRTDDDWTNLADTLDLGEELTSLRSLRDRRADEERIEMAIATRTAAMDGSDLADALQAQGMEAVPVQDFGDCFDDPQLRHRDHLEMLTHPNLGEGGYERNGFRLPGLGSGYGSPSPLLGEHTRVVLSEWLGLTDAEIGELQADGALD